MSCDMSQGEGLVPIPVLFGEAEGESRLSSLTLHPAGGSPFVAELLWPHGGDEEAVGGFQITWGACIHCHCSFMMGVLSLTRLLVFAPG